MVVLYKNDKKFTKKINRAKGCVLLWNKNAQSDISQIKAQKYVHVLEEHKGNLLLVRINYDKKKKEQRKDNKVIKKVLFVSNDKN